MVAVDVLLPEHRRFCVSCHGPVGRGRQGRPGRLRGTCPWCRSAFDLRPHLEPGTVLEGRRGAWRVVGPLARGGHAWLHRLHDDGAGAGGDAVLTRVRGPGGDEAGPIAVDEPEVLLALHHPGLVGVRDVVDGPGRQRHLVLDTVAGDAWDTVAGGATGAPCPAPVAAAVVLAALPAVAHLHDAGLLHADLKPAHLLVTPDGVVVIDLGSVRRADDRTSPVWGTEGFLAPEVVPRGAGPSTASDVWALGRTLAVLTGSPDVGGRPRRVPDPPADPRLARVVAAATAPDPARRPPLSALATALTDLAGGVPAAPPPRAARPGRTDPPGPGDDGRGAPGVHEGGRGVPHRRRGLRPAVRGDDHARGAANT